METLHNVLSSYRNCSWKMWWNFLSFWGATSFNATKFNISTYVGGYIVIKIKNKPFACTWCTKRYLVPIPLRIPSLLTIAFEFPNGMKLLPWHDVPTTVFCHHLIAYCAFDIAQCNTTPVSNYKSRLDHKDEVKINVSFINIYYFITRACIREFT